MDDDGATLILTRPAERSEAFLALCEARLGRRISAVVSPVIEIEPFGDVPDLAPYETIVLTAASAVSRLSHEGRLAGRKVATVGERTAELAAGAGAIAECLGENVESFLAASAGLKGPCLHCRGVHARGDLAIRLTEAGVPCDEAVIYDQVPKPLNSAARALLAGQGPVVLPLFSPRSAQLVGQAGRVPDQTIVVAMSEAVAEAWPAGGDVRIAQYPNNDAMCDMVIAAL